MEVAEISPGEIYKLGKREICIWDCVVKNKSKVEIEYITELGDIFIREFEIKTWNEAAKLIGRVQ